MPGYRLPQVDRQFGLGGFRITDAGDPPLQNVLAGFAGVELVPPLDGVVAAELELEVRAAVGDDGFAVVFVDLARKAGGEPLVLAQPGQAVDRRDRRGADRAARHVDARTVVAVVRVHRQHGEHQLS